MDETFEAMLDAQCQVLKEQQESEAHVKASSILNKFREYISSRSFDDKCKEKAKAIGIKDYKVVKNAFISTMLNKVANFFNLTIQVTSDIVKFAIKFLAKMATTIVVFTQDVCHKIINLFTLNCGTV